MTDFLSWFVTGSHKIRYFPVSEFIFSTEREFEYCNFQMFKKDIWEKKMFPFQKYLALEKQNFIAYFKASLQDPTQEQSFPVFSSASYNLYNKYFTV